MQIRDVLRILEKLYVLDSINIPLHGSQRQGSWPHFSGLVATFARTRGHIRQAPWPDFMTRGHMSGLLTTFFRTLGNICNHIRGHPQSQFSQAFPGVLGPFYLGVFHDISGMPMCKVSERDMKPSWGQLRKT